MIERYKTPQIEDTWSDIHKINIWKNIELHYVNALYKFKSHLDIKEFSEDDLKIINEHLSDDLKQEDLDEMLRIELETKHDFLSFLTMLENKVPANSGRWLHFGLTSSDILDTANSVRCSHSLTLVKNEVVNVISTLNRSIKSEAAHVDILARTHGQAAEVQKVKDVFNRWLTSIRSLYDFLLVTEKNLRVGKLSGAVGNHTINCEGVEGLALSAMGLIPMKNASQIIPRDLYLDYFYALLKVMLFIEKVSSDIRYYSQSEISEICEGFAEGQKGSSAMPHKKNPIMSENLTGLVRLAKGYMQIAIDNCQTQLERDISHSSAERIIFEDMAHLAHFGLMRLNDVLINLVVNKTNCEYNINKNRNKLDSQKKLVELLKNGLSRKESHDLIQQNLEKGGKDA